LRSKVLAHRLVEDEDDVRLLARELERKDGAAVLDLASDVFGERLDASARFFVERIFTAESPG
jgi:hypothetical protein